jgi:hypothetical protein
MATKVGFRNSVSTETEIESGRFEGRVEHIPSCEEARFRSLEELLAFMARVLIRVRDEEQP